MEEAQLFTFPPSLLGSLFLWLGGKAFKLLTFIWFPESEGGQELFTS